MQNFQDLANEYAQQRQQHAAAAREQIPPATTHAQHLGLTHENGARVLDEVTGCEGTVTAGAITHGVQSMQPAANPAAARSIFDLPESSTVESVQVQLDDGSVVKRSPLQLVALPAALAVPLEDFATVTPSKEK